MNAPDPNGLARAREAYMRELVQRPDQDAGTLVAAIVRAYLAGQAEPGAAQAMTAAGLRYVANEFACNVDDPTHRERVRKVTRASLDMAADEIQRLGTELGRAVAHLRDWESEKSIDNSAFMPPDHPLRVRTRQFLDRVKS